MNTRVKLLLPGEDVFFCMKKYTLKAIFIFSNAFSSQPERILETRNGVPFKSKPLKITKNLMGK